MGISLITNDVQHLFRGLLAIHIFICFFDDVAVQISCPFLNWVVSFYQVLRIFVLKER